MPLTADWLQVCFGAGLIHFQQGFSENAYCTFKYYKATGRSWLFPGAKAKKNKIVKGIINPKIKIFIYVRLSFIYRTQMIF